MTIGYVYVLSNPHMPGLVKIGRTTRSVEARIKEFSDATGVPSPFHESVSFLFPDCELGERLVHGRMADCRLSEGREFFRCESIAAAQIVEDTQREVVEAWLDDFIPDQTMVDSECFIGISLFADAAQHYDLAPQEIPRVLNFVSVEDLGGAVNRYRNRLAKERKEALRTGEAPPPIRVVK